MKSRLFSRWLTHFGGVILELLRYHGQICVEELLADLLIIPNMANILTFSFITFNIASHLKLKAWVVQSRFEIAVSFGGKLIFLDRYAGTVVS